MKIYICKCCKDEWEFYPRDYGYEPKKYPKLCPLCEMPVIDMIRDVHDQEGIRGVIRMIICRIKFYFGGSL